MKKYLFGGSAREGSPSDDVEFGLEADEFEALVHCVELLVVLLLRLLIFFNALEVDPFRTSPSLSYLEIELFVVSCFRL